MDVAAGDRRSHTGDIAHGDMALRPCRARLRPYLDRVRQSLLEAFAAHDSASVQHTMYAMGQAVLDRVADVAEIDLVMPNKHHLPVDLAKFGLENRNEIFVATDEPFGLIEATIAR